MEVSEVYSIVVGVLVSEEEDSDNDSLEVVVEVGVSVGVEDVELEELWLGVEVETSLTSGGELDDDVLFGCGGGGEGSDFLGEPTGLSSFSSSLSLLLAFESSSTTTYRAEPPLGTVTTQEAAPPAPTELLPTSSLTPCWDGSMAHGRPLQPSPSHTISILKVGFSSLNGVAGSR